MLNKVWYFSLLVILFVQNNLSAGLQEDINAIASAGGTVVIPAGITIVSSTLSVPNNVTLKGASANSTLKAVDGLNGPILSNADHINGNTGIRLTGFTIDGNKFGQSSGEGISFINVTDILIEDVGIHDCYFSGIKFGGYSNTISVEACTVYSNGLNIGNGITIEGKPANISIANCNIHNNKINGISSNGIDIRMVGNHVSQHAGGCGVSLHDANDTLIIGNYVQGAADAGMVINNSRNFVAMGNNVSDANSGIVSLASQDFIVNGNLATQNHDGINLNAGSAGGSGALVSNNIVSDNLRYGINSFNYGNSILAANLAINTGSVNEGGYGLNVAGDPCNIPAHLLINANESVDTRTSPSNFLKYGLRLQYMHEPLVSNNVLLNADTYDLSIGAGVTNLSGDDNLTNRSQMFSPGNCSEVTAGGYNLTGDLNNDCQVDFQDFAILTRYWLMCNDPHDVTCVANW